MNTKKHILFIGHNGGMAGAEYSLLRLIREIQSEFQITVCAPADGPFEKAITQLGIPFHHLSPLYPLQANHSQLSVLPAFADRCISNISQLSNSLEKPDIIHSNTTLVWDGAFLAAHWQIPHVWNLREILKRSASWSPLLSYENQLALMNQLSDLFVCVSSSLDDSLEGIVPASKRQVIHNGLDKTIEISSSTAREKLRESLRGKVSLDDGTRIILTVGNFIRDKGYDFLVETLSHLAQAKEYSKALNNTLFLWVGRHQEESQAIQKAIEEKQLQSLVCMPGHIDNFAQHMAACDLYILSSVSEAFPTVALEAILADIPVISRDNGGIRDIAAHGQVHILDNDSPECMSTAIGDYLMGKLTIPPLKEYPFSMKQMASHYTQAYHHSINHFSAQEQRSFLLESLKNLAEDLKPSLKLLIQERQNRISGWRSYWPRAMAKFKRALAKMR
ncbi:MAG: glycosyltransferase [Planctomycetes bacterium]|nr:glycosyltransferase [Planctomycetota bacterium]